MALTSLNWLQAEFLPQFLVDLVRGLPVESLAVRRGFRFAGGWPHLCGQDEARRLDGRAVSAARVPDAVVIRDNRDIGFIAAVVSHKPDDFGVAAGQSAPAGYLFA